MATMHLWTPPAYGLPPLRVRRNPNASIYHAFPEDEGRDILLSPNGRNMLEGAGEDALTQLQAAGPRGAAVLGATAGFVFSGWKMAFLGGLFGYFSGKYLTNIAAKALTIVTAAAATASVAAPSPKATP
jgi:hypothetical protein